MEKFKKIPKHFWYTILLSLIGLWIIFFSSEIGFRINDIRMPWNPNMMSGIHLSIMLMPFVALFIVFMFRKKFFVAPQGIKNYVFITLGVFAIFWELWYDVGSIYDGSSAFKEFIGGFDYCRMNTYIVGTLLILRKNEMLKWVAATSLFSGVSTLVDHWSHYTAPVHSVITHGVILAIFPSIAIASMGTNYKVKNLIHSHLFNWTLVLIMITVNLHINGGWEENSSRYGFTSVAGELTKNRMTKNMLVGWAGWPWALMLWILAVMMLEWIFFIVHRLIIWRTYQKDLSFKETFTEEFKHDLPQWFGFKWWGEHNWIDRYKVNLRKRWI